MFGSTCSFCNPINIVYQLISDNLTRGSQLMHDEDDDNDNEDGDVIIITTHSKHAIGLPQIKRE